MSTGGASDGPPPLLYLLHGLSDDHTAWHRYTAIGRYAETAGLAVVMPAVHRSFYANEAHGHRYWDFVSEELPAVVHEFLRVTDRPEETFVAGLSMGGYGALKLALTHPERYAAAASLSGGARPADADRSCPSARTSSSGSSAARSRDDERPLRPAAAGVRRTAAVSGVRHRGPAAARHRALRRRGDRRRRRRHPRPAPGRPRVGALGRDDRRRHRLAAAPRPRGPDCGKRGTNRLIRPSARRLFRVFLVEAQPSHQPMSAAAREE